jgi:hypothetical protein
MLDNLDWWRANGFLEQSRRAISKKLEVLGLFFDESTIPIYQPVAAFIDCNCLETSRVAGGPRGDGAAADRWDCNIQRAFYNGWKSIHGLKHQTVDIAHGFTIDMLGPTSLRRNDLRLLGLSQVNERLAEIQEGECIQSIMFGDSIYHFLSHLRTYFSTNPNVRQKLENHAYKSVRIAIEWNYGHTANLFSYLRNLEKLKVMDGDEDVVCRVYLVCTLLRNCHTALYGCQSSRYFDIAIPLDMLERFLRLI